MVKAAKYDLFISYADADRAWVEGYLLDALNQAGVRFHSESAFALGLPRLLEFERAIEQSDRTLLVLSPAYMANDVNQFIDLLAQSYDLEEATWSVIPLILEPVELPLRLKPLVNLNATNPDKWEEVIRRLCADLQRPVPALPSKPECPYPGMKPFEPENARFFYGRSQEINFLLLHLRKQNYFFVIGPSGSGKSSLVFAGLVAELKKQQPSQWFVKSLRPGSNPMQKLKKTLGICDSGHSQTVETVEKYAEWVESALLESQPGSHLLLIVDQLEELFSQAQKLDQADFIAAIKSLRQVEHCTLVLTMRADFYPDLMNSALWPVKEFERLEIAPLRGERLREAIALPAQKCGVYIEVKLLERLLNDAADEPGVLPLIQETMVLLWDKMERRLLTLNAYEKIGQEASKEHPSGLSVAIATHADATLAKLMETQQAIARRIFLRLVQFGEGRADTRRQQLVTSLQNAEDDPWFEPTLEYLVSHRLLTLSSQEGEDEIKADIAHEALIESWPTLQNWLKEWRRGERTRRRLAAKVADWERWNRKGGLLDAVELQEAKEWLASSDAAELGYPQNLPDLVEASQDAIETEIRKLRTRFFFATTSAVVAFLTATTTVFFFQKATQNSQIALTHQLGAQALLAARLSSPINGYFDRAVLLATQAVQVMDTAESQDDLLRTLQTDPQPYTYLHGNSDEVKSVAISPDGRILASGSKSGKVQLWDITEGKLVGELVQHDNPVWKILFSPDGKTLTSISEDRTVQLWDVTEQKLIGQPLKRHSDTTVSVAVSSNGNIFAYGHDNDDFTSTVYLWNLQHNQPIGQIQFEPGVSMRTLVLSPDGETLAIHDENEGEILLWDVKQQKQVGKLLPPLPVELMVFSPDNKILAVGESFGSVQLWDVVQQEPILEFSPEFEPGSTNSCSYRTDKIAMLAFSPNGDIFARGDCNGNLRLWNIKQQELLYELKLGYRNMLRGVIFSPNSRILASIREDFTVQLWNVEQQTPIGKPFQIQSIPMNSLAFSPDSRTFATGNRNGDVLLWNVEQKPVMGKKLQGHDDEVLSVAFSPDGKTLASGSADETLRFWDVARQAPLGKPLKKHDGEVSSVAFSQDSNILVSGSTDGTLLLWDAEQRKPISTPLPTHNGWVSSIAFNPDGKTVASGHTDGTILLWDMVQQKPISPPLKGHRDTVKSLAFSPDGKILASGGSFDASVQLWDVARQETIGKPLKGHRGFVYSVAFSPDGKTLASSGSWDGDVKLWDVEQQILIDNLLQENDIPVDSVAFSPDGKILASGNGRGMVQLWDVEQRTSIGEPLQGHSREVKTLAFSPDGKTLASGSADKTVILWDLDLHSRACRIAGRNLTQEEWERYMPENQPYQKTCLQYPEGK